jgi:hypothetical protein
MLSECNVYRYTFAEITQDGELIAFSLYRGGEGGRETATLDITVLQARRLHIGLRGYEAYKWEMITG